MEDLKILFSKFVAVANDIRALHESNELGIGSGSNSAHVNAPMDISMSPNETNNNWIANPGSMPQMGTGYNGSVGAYYNVPMDISMSSPNENNSNWITDRGSMPQMGAGYNESAYHKDELEFSSTQASNQVLGIELPEYSTFTDNNFKLVQNEDNVQTSCGQKSQLVNYLYYLYEKPMSPDQFNVHETNNHERNVEVHEPIEQQDVNNLDQLLDVQIIEKKAKPVSSERLPKQVAEMQYKLFVQPKPVRGCDNTVMYMETSNNGSKKQCCPFCGKLNSKLPRHMEDIHGCEPDVQEFLKHSKITDQPKQKENDTPQNQQNNNFKKGVNNKTKKTGNKRTNKRQLRGSHSSATRSNKNVHLKKRNGVKAFAEQLF